jgi:predicted small lipoprotein YifL
MKKLLVLLAITSFAACGGSGSTETKTDSVKTTDSVTTTVTDSSKTVVESKDSLKSKVDSTKK